jgi:hypothetical protein
MCRFLQQKKRSEITFCILSQRHKKGSRKFERAEISTQEIDGEWGAAVAQRKCGEK